MNLTEAEDIKMRWQEYTEELYKKDLHDRDDHDGVIIHLEPNILECEVKWVLGSITMNKASGGNEIPIEIFRILTDGAVKVLHSICQQIWVTHQWPQDQKIQFSFQSQRKAQTTFYSLAQRMPKNAQTTAQVALISKASKVVFKILQARFQQYLNHELLDVQAGFRKDKGTRDQIANICWQEMFQRNIYF